MSTARKAVILFAITAVVCTLPLSAQFVQEGPGDFTGSNTKRATASIFATDMDDYMDYHGWSGINLNKWFGFVAMDQAAVSNVTTPLGGSAVSINKASLGYARKFGGIYLGAWYSGNIVQVTGDSDFEEKTVEATYDPATQKMLTKTTTTEWEESYRNATNQIEFLVGIAGQGIKLGYFHSATTDRRPQEGPFTVLETFNDSTVNYKGESAAFSRSAGHYVPYLGWGSVLKAGDLAIKPYLTFALDIYSHKETANGSDEYTTYQGIVQGDKVNTITGANNGYVKPTFSLGSDFDLPPKGDLSMTAGLGYDFGIWAYNNKYDDSGFAGNTKGTVSWNGSNTVTRSSLNTVTDTNSTLTINDITRSSHLITPTFKVSTTIEDNLKLGAKVWLPFNIAVSKEDRYSDKHQTVSTVHANPAQSQQNTTVTTDTHTASGLTESTLFSFAPRIGVGASYSLIPSRLTINAGFTASPIAFEREVKKTSPNGEDTVKTRTVDGNGVTISNTVTATQSAVNDSVAYTDTWTSFEGLISAGFALSLGSQIVMDFEAGVPVGTTSKDSFSFDLARLNVLFTLQF